MRWAIRKFGIVSCESAELAATTHPFSGPVGLKRGRRSLFEGGLHLNERSLVAELRQGHVDALDTLLRTYGGEIQAVAYLTLRNEHDAEEVLADTLLTAWQKIGTLRDPDRLRPWLLTIAIRIALRRRRRLQPRVVSLDPGAVSPSTAPATLDELELRDAINRLPPRMRAVVALNVVADLPVAEVARVLGTSENTVKSQLRVARARLRVALRDPSSSSRVPGTEKNHG